MTATATPSLSHRTATAASLVAAPALLLGSALLMPALKSDEQEQLRIIAGHSTSYLWFTLLLLAGTMLFVPAFHGLARVVHPSRAMRVGSALVVFGSMASVGDTTTQFLIRQMATHGHASPQMAAVVTSFDSSTGAAQLFAVGGLGLVVGTVMVAVTLRRARLVSWPTAAALGLGMAANLVGFIAMSKPLIVGSSAILLAALTGVTLALQNSRDAGSSRAVPATPPAAESPAASGIA